MKASQPEEIGWEPGQDNSELTMAGNRSSMATAFRGRSYSGLSDRSVDGVTKNASGYQNVHEF